MAIRTVVIDDDVANRTLLRMVFDDDPRLDLVGEAGDGLAGSKVNGD